ncbi:hypothetical protein BDN72DRAFT_434871 [Pluteus cervinus]|uniref:Uncharacterized protein n=1 Tax=Pluteus cervinus TaxID=181527 RepID=A0ACD3A729_9AGAR|nr:hypothetical protein BDN72DRAFT_434871 [Pluteus cervinus]
MTTATDLPFELVEEILIASAWSSLKQAAVLARVSRFIYELIKPVLFRTTVYGGLKNAWPCTDVKWNWLEINGGYVRNLLFSDNDACTTEVEIALETCPNLINIAIWMDPFEVDIPSFLKPLSLLRPHRLSMDLNCLFVGPFQEEHAQLPMFAHLTHLEMAGGCYDWDCMQGIQYLPRLTHLSVPRDLDEDMDMVLIIQNYAFAHCSHLAVVVLFSSLSNDTNETGEVVVEAPLPSAIQESVDPRIVSLGCEYSKDWVLGAQGGRDMWVVAEEIVERRQSTRNKSDGVHLSEVL